MAGNMFNRSNTSLRNNVTSESLNFNTIANQIWRKRDTIFEIEDSKEMEDILAIRKDGVNVKNTIARTKDNCNKEIENCNVNYTNKVTELTNNCRLIQSKIEEDYSSQIDRLSDIESELQNSVRDIEKRYSEDLERYNNHKDKQLNRMKEAKKFISNTLNNFNIKPTSYTGKITDEMVNDIELDKLISLTKDTAEQINLLDSAEEDNAIIDKINKLDDNKTKLVAGLLLASTLVAPVTLSAGAFLFGKKGKLIKEKAKKTKELENQLASYYMIIKQKERLLEDKLENSKPNRNKYDKELDNLRSDYSLKYKKDKSIIETSYLNKKSSVSNMDIQGQIQIKQKEFMDEVNKLKSEAMEKIAINNEKLTNYKENLNKKVKIFKSKQVKPNLKVDKQGDLSEKKKDIIKKLRLIDKLEMLQVLDYITELPEGEIPSEYWDKIIEYDKSQIVLRDKYKIIKDNWEKGIDEEGNPCEPINREILKRKLDEITEKETELYLVSTNDLYAGNKIISNKFIGLKDLDDNVIDLEEMVRTRFNNKSTLVVYKDNKEKEALINLLKYFMLQILVNYHSDSVFINIVNPNGTPGFDNLQIDRNYISKKIKEKGKLIKGPKYVTAYNTKQEVDDLLEQLIEGDNKLSKGDLSDKESFKELVLQRRSSGGVVPKFNINILVDMDLKNQYSRFTEYSLEKGIINIHLAKRDTIMDTKLDDDGRVEESIQYTQQELCLKYSNLIEVINLDKKIKMGIHYLDETKKSLFFYDPISKEEILECTSFLKERAIKSNSGFKTTAEFIEDVIGGPDKYWTGNAEECLSCYPGYVDGDRTKAIPIILDEVQRPHAFFAGTTGGGKSNMLSVLVNVMKLMYKPTDIEIVYFDFKIAEVAMHAAPYKMPQCSAMCGTSAPEYLCSLLDYVDNEMMRRYSLMSETGTQKLSDLRKYFKKRSDKILSEIKEGMSEEEISSIKLRAQEELDKRPARMLVLVDEAAQAFQSDDMDFKEKVKKVFVKLGQLARAAGIHMILVSQDADKMPSALMDLLKIRGCTVAPPSISKNVLKNDFCAKDENQFVGFFGINDNNGIESSNLQYVVPFGDPVETPYFTKIADGLLKSRNEKSRDAVIFSEDKPYSKLDYEDYMNKNKDNLDSHTFVLGEGVYFQQKFEPHKLHVKIDDRSSIVVCSTRTDERLKMAMQLYEGIKDKAVVMPVFAKTLYNEMPIEMFTQNSEKYFKSINQENRFPTYRYFLGKGMVNSKDCESIMHNGQGRIVYKNDILTSNGDSDHVKAITKTINEGSSTTLFGYLNAFISGRRTKMSEGSPYPTTYVMVFDLDKHSSIIDMKGSYFKALANLCNEASATDMHMIFVTSDVDLYMDKSIGGKYLCSKLDGMQYPPKVFKNLSNKFAKLYDVSGDETALIKLPA